MQDLKREVSQYTRQTIIRQALTGTASLLAGAGAIGAVLWLGRICARYTAFHYDQSFLFLSVFLGGFGVLLVTYGAPRLQFAQWSEAPEVLATSVFVVLVLGGFFGGIAALAIIPHRIGSQSSHIFVDVIVFVALTALLIVLVGLSTGGVHACSVLFFFDHSKHCRLASNKADVEQCEAGILPYRQRVISFWRAMPVVLVALVPGTMALLRAPPILLWIAIAAGLLVLAMTRLQRPAHSCIRSVEGKITKSKYENWFRSCWNRYYIHCNGQRYAADPQTWEVTLEGCISRLWYSNGDKKIIASKILANGANRLADTSPPVAFSPAKAPATGSTKTAQARRMFWLLGTGLLGGIVYLWSVFRRRER
jgi:hypothetical protein